MSRSPRKAPPSAPAEPLARGAREHYDDAVYYDYTYRRRRDDVEYYRRVARQYGGPVLELGVGTGRVGLALAHDGFDVVGLDANPAMLARCAERSARRTSPSPGGAEKSSSRARLCVENTNRPPGRSTRRTSARTRRRSS